MSELPSETGFEAGCSAWFCVLASGRLHYMPPMHGRQAVFTSNHPLLTADLQDYTLRPAFLEETVKSAS
jgi:hypothetical protein